MRTLQQDSLKERERVDRYVKTILPYPWVNAHDVELVTLVDASESQLEKPVNVEGQVFFLMKSGLWTLGHDHKAIPLFPIEGTQLYALGKLTEKQDRFSLGVVRVRRPVTEPQPTPTGLKGMWAKLWRPKPQGDEEFGLG